MFEIERPYLDPARGAAFTTEPVTVECSIAELDSTLFDTVRAQTRWVEQSCAAVVLAQQRCYACTAKSGSGKRI